MVVGDKIEHPVLGAVITLFWRRLGFFFFQYLRRIFFVAFYLFAVNFTHKVSIDKIISGSVHNINIPLRFYAAFPSLRFCYGIFQIGIGRRLRRMLRLQSKRIFSRIRRNPFGGRFNFWKTFGTFVQLQNFCFFLKGSLFYKIRFLLNLSAQSFGLYALDFYIGIYRYLFYERFAFFLSRRLLF